MKASRSFSCDRCSEAGTRKIKHSTHERTTVYTGEERHLVSSQLLVLERQRVPERERQRDRERERERETERERERAVTYSSV